MFLAPRMVFHHDLDKFGHISLLGVGLLQKLQDRGSTTKRLEYSPTVARKMVAREWQLGADEPSHIPG